MYQISKGSNVSKSAPSEDALAKINEFARVELKAEDVYVFSIRACDDQPDRDFERFTADCLKGLAALYVGKTVIFDHFLSAANQTARIYAASVEKDGNETFLRMEAYMLANETTKPLIDSIDGGILKEVSVGCAIGTATCSICGERYAGCDHRKGLEYDGKTCICELSDPTDAYEVSFVAVPAQPKAGITKSAKDQFMSIIEADRAKAEVAIEKIRFGG